MTENISLPISLFSSRRKVFFISPHRPPPPRHEKWVRKEGKTVMGKKLIVPPNRAIERLRERFSEADPMGYKDIAREALDIARESRDLLRAILPVIATFESRRRAERVSVAMRELKEERRQTRSGRPWHRPIRVTPEKLEALLKLRSQGKPWATVAQAVGLPANTCKSAAWKARRGAGGSGPPPASSQRLDGA